MTIVDRFLGRTPRRRKLEADMDEAMNAVQSLREHLKRSIGEEAEEAKRTALSAIKGLRKELASQPDT